MAILNQEDYKRDASRGLKIIGGMNTVIHCHHYNSRLQRTLEKNSKVNGNEIIKRAAAITYCEMIQNLKEQKGTGEEIELAKELYSFLGFGTLDFGKMGERIIISESSHYVEGWRCGSVKTKGTVCRMTEGFIEGAYKAIWGKDVSVSETQCMNQGCETCQFEVEEIAEPKYDFNLERFREFSFKDNKETPEVASNIDKSAIIDAVLNMSLEGNNEGLIPAFNVYLAHTPQDFYNIVCISFIKEMGELGLAEMAEEMLVEDAENCALNTFGGILDSEEWRGLIAPMVKKEEDVMFGLVAVANALGWGRINITEHTPHKTIQLESYNGYEAYGYIEFEKFANSPQCFMLKGITAGLMSLVYEKGDLEDRVGKYIPKEISCLAQKKAVCCFSSSINKE